jgi:CubicO group peptidase (beta-lactamase class C family)
MAAVVGAAVLALAAGNCAKERSTGSSSGWSEARIDTLIAMTPALLLEYAVPGVAIVLIHGSEVQWAAGFGVTAPDGEPVSPGTVFPVASLGKPVFAHLVDLLVTERSWRLDEPIGQWGVVASHDREWHSLTAESLLSHTSGLTYDPATDRVALDLQRQGEWQYSGAGYVLVQRVVEQSESRELDAIARDMLFRPLGLETMGFVTGDTRPVRGHDRNGEVLRSMPWTESNAASSLHASALDYARFLMHASGLGATAPRTWTRLTAPQVTVREDLGLGWGLGWALEQDSSGAISAFHWGSNPGFKSFALVDRGRSVGMVILTNGDNGLDLVEDVVRIIDSRPHPLFQFYMLHPDD